MMRNLNVIYIKNEQENIWVSFKMKRAIKFAISNALDEEGITDGREVSVTLTDNETIKKLNLKYRNIDKLTDVLSFPLNEEGEREIGDIVISLEQAETQALEYGNHLIYEVMFLCVHSVLHLLGYDHGDDMKNPNDSTMYTRQYLIMERLEKLHRKVI